MQPLRRRTHLSVALSSTAAMIVAATGLGAVPALSVPAAADGVVARVRTVTVATGPSPFETLDEESGNHVGACGDANYGYRNEPHIAVHPDNGELLATVWRQDRNMGNVVAVSQDGGESWEASVLPGLDCTDDSVFGASDPTVTIGSDGTLYVMSLRMMRSSEIDYDVVLHRSADRGRTWEGPIVVFDQSFHDLPAVSAHPTTPGVLYATVRKYPGSDEAPQAYPERLVFFRSEDWGDTWTSTGAYTAPPGHAVIVRGASVLPGGTLVIPFAVNLLTDQGVDGVHEGKLHVARSTTGGRTWETSQIGTFTWQVPGGHDPERGTAIKTAGAMIEHAVGPAGEVQLVWGYNASVEDGKVFTMRSDDGGLSWSGPVVVAAPGAQVLDPMVSIAPDGDVAVLWADLRRDDEQVDDALTGDWWIARSSDEGRTWQDEHVSGPFDLRQAREFPEDDAAYLDDGAAYFLGDYYGLAATGYGFAGAIVEPRPPRWSYGRSCDELTLDGGCEVLMTQTDVKFAHIVAPG